MKKTLNALALGAVMMGLSLGAPVAAVSVESEAVTASALNASEKVAAAVKQAETALDVTEEVATSATNAKQVAAMRIYLQGWVRQARTVGVEQLSAAEAKELVAALEEGARGLRMTAGVDRKVQASDRGDSDIVNMGVIQEPRVMKEAAQSEATVKAEPVAKTNEMSVSSKVKAVANLAEATVRTEKPTAAQTAVSDDLASSDLVDVPKTGADEEERTASAARGIGLVLGGAVVFAAAAGAVLIVKRMKRGL